MKLEEKQLPSRGESLAPLNSHRALIKVLDTNPTSDMCFTERNHADYRKKYLNPSGTGLNLSSSKHENHRYDNDALNSSDENLPIGVLQETDRDEPDMQAENIQ